MTVTKLIEELTKLPLNVKEMETNVGEIKVDTWNEYVELIINDEDEDPDDDEDEDIEEDEEEGEEDE